MNGEMKEKFKTTEPTSNMPNLYTEADGMRKRDHLQALESKRHPSLLNAIFRAYVRSRRKIQTERFSQLISENSCVSKWTASNAPWNMRRRGLLLRVTSLMLTMSARGADINGEDVVQRTIEAESLDHTPRVCRWTASACRRYDWSFDR